MLTILLFAAPLLAAVAFGLLRGERHNKEGEVCFPRPRYRQRNFG